jgi:hypothetical protein
MLDQLPNDVVAQIVMNVTDLKDIIHLFCVCKSMKHFLQNWTKCLNVTLKPYVRLNFVKQLYKLEHLAITRKYDTILDLHPLHYTKNLQHIYINNGRNIINVPPSCFLSLGKDRLIDFSLIYDSDDDDKHSESEDLITQKDYYYSRYRSKKYVKIMMKRMPVLLKSKFVPHSL